MDNITQSEEIGPQISQLSIILVILIILVVGTIYPKKSDEPPNIPKICQEKCPQP